MTEDIEKNILAPHTYILAAKTNLLCATKLPMYFNCWMKISKETMDAIRDITITVQNSIILFDVIQDGARYRRTLPAAHCVYGVPMTLNASIHGIFLGLEKTIKLGHPQGADVYTKLMLDLMRGQGMEIYWRENFIIPTEEEYKQAAVKKTGSALWFPLKMMQLFSKDKTDYNKLMTNISIYLQIRDDYCNITNPEALEERASETKVEGMNETHVFEDITEGKISWVIIHALQTSEASNILNILKQHTSDLELKKKCVSLMDQVGSLQYTRDTLHAFDKECRDEIKRLGGNPGLEVLLDDLRNWDTDYYV